MSETVESGFQSREIASTETSDWVYKAEGKAHIVFGYRGLVSAFIGRVLRIRKSEALAAYEETQVTWREVLLPQIVPKGLLVEGIQVTLRLDWLRNLLRQAESARPGWRLAEASEQGVVSTRAYLLEDLTCAAGLSPDQTVVSVEIKPKWGFLPSPDFLIPPESIPIKTRNCRFCLHQHLRASTLGRDSAYCPLDLYSDHDERMVSALEKLWKRWSMLAGKGNNWRVFVDGREVLPEDTDQLPGEPEVPVHSRTQSFIAPILKSSNILPMLKTLQSTLDPTDISDLVFRFRVAHPHVELFAQNLIPEPSDSELAAFVQLYLSSPRAGSKDEAWSLRQRLIAYSLSAIFKDCSIFVKAVLTASGNDSFVLDKEKSKVKLIDFDLKPMRALRKWAELDEKIWRHWMDD